MTHTALVDADAYLPGRWFEQIALDEFELMLSGHLIGPIGRHWRSSFTRLVAVT